MRKIIDINLYAYGNGSNNANCEQGPAILKQALMHSDFAQSFHFTPELKSDGQWRQQGALPDIAYLSAILAKNTQRSVLNHHFFITLGGDHTEAIGCWSGAATVVNHLGLIWFDAHMDSHTPQTSETQNIHGMPLAILLGHGEKILTRILSDKPKLKPENVVLIGVRSFESSEAALLKKLGVIVFYMDDIKKFGMKKIIRDAIEIVTRNTNYFGISIDLDGFDPIDAPGVGAPAPDGVRVDDFLMEFKTISQHPKLIGADIAEFNPVLDKENKTEKLAVALCRALSEK